MWDVLFAAANGLALLCWLALILGPRGNLPHAVIMYVGVGLLCLTYTILLATLLTGLLDPVQTAESGGGSFTSIEGVRSFFLSDGGVTVGWIHYLALDLFTGLWIARDADGKAFQRWWQVPVLIVTFLAGPVGLLIWLAIREKAARRAAGMRSRIKS
jgi:hypothetical protein